MSMAHVFPLVPACYYSCIMDDRRACVEDTLFSNFKQINKCYKLSVGIEFRILDCWLESRWNVENKNVDNICTHFEMKKCWGSLQMKFSTFEIPLEENAESITRPPL